MSILKNQFSNNLFFNVVSLVINIIIGLLYTPFLVKYFGVSTYAFIPLALLINQYIGFLSTSLTNSLTRFYSVSISEKDYVSASRYLTSSFIGVICLIFISCPIVIYIVYNIDWIFNIPSNIINDVQILFFFSALAFFLSLFSSLLNVTLYALNRLDLLAALRIFRNVAKILFTLIILYCFTNSISTVGYSMFLTEVGVLIMSFIFYKKNLNKKVILSFRYFHWSALYIIFSMTMWVILHSLGDIFLYGTDIFFINKFWSSLESGIVGGFNELNSYINSVIVVFTSLIGPTILISFSQKKHWKVKKIAINNVLIIGLMSSFIVGCIIGFSPYIISYWIGEQYVIFKSWLILRILVLPFHIASGVFLSVIKSWNYVRIPALGTIVLGILNAIVIYSLCIISNGNIKYINLIIITVSFIDVCQSYFLCGYCVNKIYPDITWRNILNIFGKLLFAVVLVVILIALLSCALLPSGLYEVFLVFIVTTIIFIPIMMYGILNGEQRSFIYKLSTSFRLKNEK